MSVKIQYVKKNGEVSEREIIIVSNPNDKLMVYDVSALDVADVAKLEDAMSDAVAYREERLTEFTEETGVQVNTLWRSLIPRSVTWL